MHPDLTRRRRLGWANLLTVPLCALAVASTLTLAACGSDDGGGDFALADEVQFTITPASVVFEAIPAGDAASQQVTLRHIGSAGTLRLLDISFVSGSSDLFLDGPRSATLAAGESVVWEVRYQADDAAPDAGVIRIVHNVVGTPTVEIPVSTPGYRGELLTQPVELAFGEVEHGASASLPLRLQNVGSAPLTISGLDFSFGGEDFATSADGLLPLTLAVGSDEVIDVTYTPTGWNVDTATLVVTAVDIREARVPVSGAEVGPVLRAQPEQVPIGAVAVGEKRIESLALANLGSSPLRIEDVQLAAGAAPGLGLEGVADALPATVQPGERLWIDVAFEPTDAAPSGELGRVLVISDDPVHPQLAVPVLGGPGAPVISVVPDVMDFGFVGTGITAGKTVTILNLGQVELTVASVGITDDPAAAFGVDVDPGFKPTFEVPSPQTIAPGGTADVRVTFTNEAGVEDRDPKVFSTLVVASDDPERPIVRVDLAGRRAGSPTCSPAFAPTITDFGGVAHLTTQTRDATLVNQGTGNCVLQQLWIDACQGDAFSQTCQDGVNSVQFEFASVPAMPLTLGPGDAVAIPVRFDAPFFSNAGEGAGVARHYARLGAAVQDPHAGVVRKVPDGGPGLIPGPNLRAASGIPRLDVYPDEFDFGLVASGCRSLPALITLSSGGPIPVTVTSVGPGLCDEGFGLADTFETPRTLASGQSVGLSPVFDAGASLGPQTCGYQVASDDPAWPVRGIRLSATAVEETTVTEVFTGDEVSLVDVLFVVDNSGSMSEEQMNLAANFEVFISAATAWNVDYQIAVTTTDMDNGNGDLQGDEPIITPANADAFLSNVLVGTGGSGSERGLAAAEAALTGSFAPFLREEASLAVIFVSDEDDQSPEDPAYYVAAFDALKSDSSRFAGYAIVGEPGGCNSASGSASAGLRYIYVADSSGGDRASICDGSFAEALAEFGAGAFGPKTTFPLQGTPVLDSVVVSLDGTPCADGWEVDAGARKLVFDSEGPCVPDDGSEVTVTYDLLCL